uniref:Nucleocapsid protein n=1 Tax=Culex pseudovishnui bunya-like virus TaxID=2686043 RepID=A0A6F8PZ55_9VIRU|nr:nucleocapsid protein [Culex pseudovishnui bunya-like virus]
MSSRANRCICHSKFAKRSAIVTDCSCSASIIRERYLADNSYSHWYISPEKLKEELSVCNKALVEAYLSKLRFGELIKFQRVVPVVVQKLKKVLQSNKSDDYDLNPTALQVSGEKEASVLGSIMSDSLSADYQTELTRILSDPLGEFPNTFNANLAEFLKVYEYKGFDVKRIQFLVAFRQSRLKSGSVLLLEENKKGRHIDLTGHHNLNQVILLCIALFNHRGNNLEAIKSGLGTGLIESSFVNFATGMGLKSNVIEKGAKTKSPDILTLARIAAAFPIHALKLAASESNTRKVVSLADVGLAFDSLGKVMCHPVAPSVLDSDMIKTGAIWITFLASLRLNQLIGGKNKADPDRLWLYHRSALCSPAADEPARTKFWETMELDGLAEIAVEARLKVEALVKDKDVLKEIGEFTLPNLG